VRPDVIVLCKAETLIGRYPPEDGIDLQLLEPHVNRRHARITCAEGACWIEDLKSVNGTWVNNVRVSGRAPLTDGDEIRVGSYSLYFCGGDPLRPVTISAEWLTDTVRSLAGYMYETCDLSAMPILADALQDAGCADDLLLGHCRSHAPHVRGCWALNLVLGNESRRAEAAAPRARHTASQLT
jgi:hypothetical protein